MTFGLWHLIIVIMESKKVFSLRKALSLIMPVLVVLVASLAAVSPLFLYGIGAGDDLPFHLAQSYALWYAAGTGSDGMAPLPLLMGDYAVFPNLFYAPLSHYEVEAVYAMISWTGADVIPAVKIVIFLSVFISGIFAWLLAKKMGADETVAPLLGALFCVFPYREVNFFMRGALPEGLAIGLIPVCFYGFYGIFGKEKPKASSFVCLVVGMSSLVLTHPFTAMMTALALGIFFLFSLPRTFGRFRDWRFDVMLISSVVLVVGLVGFYVFPMLSAMKSGFYKISDAEAMWMTRDFMKSRITLSYLSYFVGIIVPLDPISYFESAEIKGFCFVFFAILTAVSIRLFDTLRKDSPFRTPIVFGLSSIPLCFASASAPGIAPASLMLLAAVAFEEWHASSSPSGLSLAERPEPWKKEENYLFDFAPAAVVLVACCIMAFSTKAWDYLPSFFLAEQFPFRVYSLIGFALFVFAVVLAKRKDNASARMVELALASSILLAFAQAPVSALKDRDGVGGVVMTEAGYSLASGLPRLGWQNEYTPACFQDANYVPEYPNGLYYEVKKTMDDQKGFPQGADEYPSPSVLSGSGTVSVLSVQTPSVSLSVDLSSDCLIQLPQYWYDGYAATASFADGRTESLTVSEADGLVAVSVPSGRSAVSVSYVGTKTMRVFKPVFVVSLVGTVGLGLVGWELLRKRKDDAVSESL
jgi:hypothetical protein